MINSKRQPKILFFVADSVPTNKEFELAEKIGGNVVFRNVNFVPETGALEECDGVAGLVPETYKHLALETSEVKKPVQVPQNTPPKQAASVGKPAAPVWKPNN